GYWSSSRCGRDAWPALRAAKRNGPCPLTAADSTHAGQGVAKCRSSVARSSSTRTRHAPLERRQPDCRDAPAIAGSAEETDRPRPKAAAPPHPARASELAQRSSTRPFVRFACIAAAAAGGYRTGERGEHRAYVRAKSPRDPVRYSVRASPGR